MPPLLLACTESGGGSGVLGWLIDLAVLGARIW